MIDLATMSYEAQVFFCKLLSAADADGVICPLEYIKAKGLREDDFYLLTEWCRTGVLETVDADKGTFRLPGGHS